MSDYKSILDYKSVGLWRFHCMGRHGSTSSFNYNFSVSVSVVVLE